MSYFDSKMAHNGCKWPDSSSSSSSTTTKSTTWSKSSSSFSSGKRSSSLKTRSLKPSLNTTDIVDKNRTHYLPAVANAVDNIEFLESSSWNKIQNENRFFKSPEYYKNLEWLHNSFPEMDKSILSDVFASTEYDLTKSTQFLSLMVMDKPKPIEEEDPTRTGTSNDRQVPDEWVVINDEWEVLNDKGDTVPTYVEVLMQRGQKTSSSSISLKQTSKISTTLRPLRPYQSNVFMDETPGMDDAEFLSIKHLGQRRLNYKWKHKMLRVNKNKKSC